MIWFIFRSFQHRVLTLVAGAILLAAVTVVLPMRAKEAGVADAKLITRATDLLDLSSEQSKKEYPVRLQGIVTLFDQAAGLCFVHDGVASVYVYTTSPLDLLAGDRVNIAGFTGAGLYSPIVQRAAIMRIGQTNLPPAKMVTVDQLASGREDCQFVQVEGIVHTEWKADHNCYLKIGNGNSTLQVCVLRCGSTTSTFVNAKVRVQGVAVIRRSGGLKSAENQLFVSSPEQVQILESVSSESFSAPVLLGHNLLNYSHQGRSEHCVHVRGVVTYAARDKTLYIRDESGAIRVVLDKPEGPLHVGDGVDCIGFVALNSYAPMLTDAECRVTTNRVQVPALPVGFVQASSGEFDGELVRLKATVVEVEPISMNDSAILLESDRRIFRAILPVSKQGLNLRLGTELSVTGICVVSAPEAQRSDAFQILARGKEDIEVLSLPSWWRNQSVPWMIGLSITALSGIGWSVSMRRQVRRQTEAIGKREQLLADSVQKEVALEIQSRTHVEAELRLREQQLKAAIEERERIARDLHDGLIQSIYAIGLNIEDCRCTVPEAAPEVRAYLRKIKGDLNRVIEEVRNFIMGIESSTVTGSEFKTALKSMVLTIAESQRGKVRIDVDRRAADELTPDQATQLLHVAREAMTNCLRHSDAGLVVFSLLRHGSHIRFEVKDDGNGFNVNLPAARGLGLRNMAARAAEMGATYTLVSEIGSGTRIVLDFQPKNSVS